MSNVSLFKTDYTTTENIEQLSNKLGEPEWLFERRIRAFESFLDLPYDQDTLFYKYTNFRKLNPEKLTPMWEINRTNEFPREKTVPTSIELDSSIQIELNDEMKEKGVIFTSIQELVKSDEALAKKIISKIDSFSDKFDKLGLLARTFTINTLVLYIPKGVILEKPIIKEVYNTQGAFTSFNEFIGYFEQNTQIEILEVFRSTSETNDSTDQIYTSMNTLYLEDNANVKHSQVQAWSRNVVHIMSKVVSLQNYAKLTSLTHLQGGQMTRQNSLINLTGRGSEGYDLFINFGNNKQRFDVKSELKHVGEDTIGQTHSRAVMTDKSESILRGLITIYETAINADSWLTSKGMTVGKAKISAIPSLAILQNDVKAAHAASVEPLNENTVFYLESRGIEKATAREMLVKGYFEHVLKKYNNEESSKISREFLNNKWTSLN